MRTLYLLCVTACENEVYMRQQGNPVGRWLVEHYSPFAGETFEVTPLSPTIYWDEMRARDAHDRAYCRFSGFKFEVVAFEERAP